MEEQTTSEVGAEQQAPQLIFSHRHLMWIGIAATALILLIGACMWFYTPTIEAWNISTVPVEIRGAQFVQSQLKDKVSKISGVHFTTSSSNEAALRAFFTASSTRGDLSGFSPTKNWGLVAAAEKPLSSADAENPQLWKVVMVIPSLKKEMQLGSGFSPFFIGNSHIVRFTEKGLMLHYLGGGVDTLLLPHSFVSASVQTSHTEDGLLVAWRESGTSDVYVYRLSTVAAVPVGHLQGVTGTFSLTKDALYDVRWTPKGTTVTKFGLSDGSAGKVIHTFPASFGITALSI